MATFLKAISNLFLKVGTSIIRVAYHGFLVVLYLGRKQVVPAIDNPLLLKSAVTLADEIREGKVKSEDLVKVFITRIREVNPYINAMCDERFQEALEEARKVDQLISLHSKTSQQLEEETPLLGVPFTVKILISVKGMPCNAASLLHKDVKAYEDAETVTLMKKAGAVCLAVTNSSEFGLNFETYNNIYGITRNPYDTTKSSGGSSGGEGALIASGGSLFGIGNDIAGSIRHPSNFNGIFGHKPTAGLISNKGVFPVPDPKTNNYLTAGPMCRYSDDLAITTRILCGSKAAGMKFNDPVDFSKLKLYYALEIENPLFKKVSPDVKNAILEAVNHFRSVYGVEAKEINLNTMRRNFVIYAHMLLSSLDKKMEETLSGGKLDLNPTKELLKAMFFQSKITIGPIACLNAEKLPMIYSTKKLPKMREQLEKIRQELDGILNENSVLLMPAFPTTAHYHYESFPLLINVSYMAIFNILGNPVTQCPVGLSKDKLPLGFQIVGAKEQDHLTIACAREMEKAFGGWVPPNYHETKFLSTAFSEL